MAVHPSDERRHYGEYDVQSLLGRGSMGKVFLAKHRRIGRSVALKTVHLEQRFEDEDDRREFYRRLQREAELCGALQHPNVVTLYDVGYEDDVISYLATEYVDGEPLLARLKRTRPLPLPEALRLGADVLRGLAYAHSKGIIHRDIKPANILITADGDAKIADFGIARPLESSLTASNSLLGTPNYMSPEQVKSQPVTTRSDLFSVGVVLYEMLTGVKPFAAPDLSGILYNVVGLNPRPANELNPAIPQPLSMLVAKLLAKSPADRYANAAEALAELETIRSVLEPPRGAPDYGTLTPDVTTPLGQTVAVDETTSLPSTEIDAPPRHPLRRPVPQAVFWLVTLGAACTLVFFVANLRARAKAEQPTAVITPQQRETSLAKRRGLAEARELAGSGRYDEAIVRYDELLARYPEMRIAREERQGVWVALHDASQSEVTTTAPRKRPTRAATQPKAKEPEPEKKPGRWQRFKRWLRG